MYLIFTVLIHKFYVTQTLTLSAKKKIKPWVLQHKNLTMKYAQRNIRDYDWDLQICIAWYKLHKPKNLNKIWRRVDVDWKVFQAME